ncbi:MAG: hypothetical protein ACLPSO_16875 [Terracidiphilus sp.]
MADKKQSEEAVGSTELLRDLLITELAKAGVPQLENRKIDGCYMHRVSRMARQIKQEGKQ